MCLNKKKRSPLSPGLLYTMEQSLLELFGRYYIFVLLSVLFCCFYRHCYFRRQESMILNKGLTCRGYQTDNNQWASCPKHVTLNSSTSTLCKYKNGFRLLLSCHGCHALTRRLYRQNHPKTFADIAASHIHYRCKGKPKWNEAQRIAVGALYSDKCHWCHHPVVKNINSGIWQASVDRINSDLPYSSSNVVLACMGCQLFYADQDRHQMDTQLQQALATIHLPVEFVEVSRLNRKQNYYYRRILNRLNQRSHEKWTRNDVEKLRRSCGDRCCISGIPFNWENGNLFTPSIDRIVCGNLGGEYSKDNVQLMICPLNRAKYIYNTENIKIWWKHWKQSRARQNMDQKFVPCNR